MINNEINNAICKLNNQYKNIETTAILNQQKVLNSFKRSNVALRHFAGTSGYGYDDIGRDTLGNVFADVFGAEAAIISPLITSGTHAITIALFGLLRSGDSILSISGNPYDTLMGVFSGEDGSLEQYNVAFDKVDLLGDGSFDKDAIADKLNNKQYTVVYIQRSRGYDWRRSTTINDIESIVATIRQYNPSACILTDNCYGEFVETKEPTEVGVDVCVGSMIKNPGGGICPTGGYIVGVKKYVDKIAGRLTAPSVGAEVGSYAYGYRLFYQGVFLAPHVVSQALKTTLLISQVMHDRGYDVNPLPNDTNISDIVCAIKFNDKDKAIKFCQSIQYSSPIDSNVTPMPWDMPGYNDQVIMAAGCFVQGSSIELSCDAPIRPPYIVYVQGGITFEHGLLALSDAVNALDK